MRRAAGLAATAWNGSRYNSYNLTDDHFDLLEPSKFARPSPDAAGLHGGAGSGQAARAIR